MGQLFTLTQGTKAVIQAGLDDLITELGKMCRLVYPPKYNNCTNCVVDPIGGKSSNHYLHGGPIPFTNGGTCPMCNGEFKIAESVTEDMKMLCAWEPKKFFIPIPNLNIRAPGDIIQTKGFLVDLPKIMRCDHMIFQTAIEGLVRKKFKLSGQPGDQSNIIQNRYFVATWNAA